MAAADCVGKFAQVQEAGTPGWGPEGLVTYPEGLGGFIVGSDSEGRAVVALGYFFGKLNPNLKAYGEIAFELEDLHIGDGVQSWGTDDRAPASEEPSARPQGEQSESRSERRDSHEPMATGVGSPSQEGDDAPSQAENRVPAATKEESQT